MPPGQSRSYTDNPYAAESAALAKAARTLPHTTD